MGQFQFSLQSMLAAVAILAVGAVLAIAEPSWQVGALECLFLGWVPASAAILSVYSTTKARAFWMGFTAEAVLPPVIYLAAFIGFDSPIVEDFTPSLGHFRFFLVSLATHFRPVLTLWAFAPVVGLLCVSTHWLFVRPPISNE